MAATKRGKRVTNTASTQGVVNNNITCCSNSVLTTLLKSLNTDLFFNEELEQPEKKSAQCFHPCSGHVDEFVLSTHVLPDEQQRWRWCCLKQK